MPFYKTLGLLCSARALSSDAESNFARVLDYLLSHRLRSDTRNRHFRYTLRLLLP